MFETLHKIFVVSNKYTDEPKFHVVILSKVSSNYAEDYKLG